jgi:LPS sulfotransferase NodH
MRYRGRVNPPLFIVGAGRSGSTMLMDLLSHHPEIAWLSTVAHRYPTRFDLHRRALESVDAPVVGRRLLARLGPREAYGFWEAHSPGFRRPHRDLLATDVTRSRRDALVAAVAAQHTSRRDRFVAKITGWPRVSFLREVFPDARFVHLVRDGRAVAASFSRMTVDHWWGWRGPENWRYGKLEPAYQALWDGTGQSYIVLAGIQWMLVLDAIERIRAAAGDALIDVRYEDLCAAPAETIDAILRHGGIAPSDAVHRAIGGTLEARNDGWKKEFSVEQQGLLDRALADHLARYGY